VLKHAPEYLFVCCRENCATRLKVTEKDEDGWGIELVMQQLALRMFFTTCYAVHVKMQVLLFPITRPVEDEPEQEFDCVGISVFHNVYITIFLFRSKDFRYYAEKARGAVLQINTWTPY